MRFKTGLLTFLAAGSIAACSDLPLKTGNEQKQEPSSAEPGKVDDSEKPSDQQPIAQDDLASGPSIGTDALLDQVAIDLSKVRALALSKSASASLIQTASGESGGLTVNAVMEDGSEEQVLFTGNASSSRVLRSIRTPKHILFEPVSTVRRGEADCYIIVLTIATGKLNCVPDVRLAIWSGDRPIMEWDTSGDIISFLGYPSKNEEFTGYSQLFRVDMRPEIPTVAKLYAGEGHAEKFSVNGSGDVIFVASPWPQRILRVEKVGGGFQPMGDGEPVRCLVSGPANDADSFFYSDGGSKVVRVGKNDGVFTPGDYQVGENPDFNLWSDCGPVFKTQDRVFVAPYDSGAVNADGKKPGAGYLVELVNPTATPRRLNIGIEGVHRITKITYVGDAAFLLVADSLGNSAIVRFDLATEAFTLVLGFGEYVISDISAAKSDLVGFSGKRLTDGADVLGTAADGQATISSEKLGEVKSLIQLN